MSTTRPFVSSASRKLLRGDTFPHAGDPAADSVAVTPRAWLWLAATVLLMLGTMTDMGSAQPVAAPLPYRVGAFGGLSLNRHPADFHGLPGVPSCCPVYESGSGTGFTAGALFEMPLGDLWSVSMRANYVAHDATLTSTENSMVEDASGAMLPAIIEHRIDAGIGTLALQPMIGYRITGGLTVHAGGRIGILVRKSYEQRESLLEPVGTGTFENGLRTRNVLSGTVPDASPVQAGLVGGLSYALPLNTAGSLLLVPEVFYHLGVTGLVADRTWRANALTTGLSLQYALGAPSPAPEPPRPVTPPAPPPPPPPEPVLAARLEVRAVNPDGSEEPVVRIRMEEFVTRNLRPLLPYVFFDEQDARIPARYAALESAGTAAFAPDALHMLSTLDTYRQLLNIIGWRMRQAPKATLTLTGCNAQTPGERGLPELSLQRAEAVREYLVTVWGISRGRITVRSRALPEKPSSAENPDGIEENRRVEIASNDDRILEPLQTEAVDRQVSPPRVRFVPHVQADEPVRSWSLTVLQDEALRHFSGAGAVPGELMWDLRDDVRKVHETTQALTCRLHVESGTSREVDAAPVALPVEQVTVRTKRSDATVTDREIAHYSLILFDFDKADISKANRRIAQLIRPGITPTSTVTITGYTDRMGEAEYNRTLSLERARNTAQLLDATKATVRGVGRDTLLHDNDTPEGRFYSRTVDVVVETPVVK